MPKLVCGQELRKAVDEGSFIIGGTAESVDALKYDFRMGDRVLKASVGQPQEIDLLPMEQRWVEPGEAVFFLTRERLDLPPNMMAVLTPKRRLAHSGVMILGGLAVDPQYKGYLLIGLYNFSSTRYPIAKESKLIGAMFYKLDRVELGQETYPAPEEVDNFPDDLIRLIANYKPVELKGLQDQIGETQRQLENLRNDLTSDKTWRDTFKASLEKHDQQLATLINLFETEQKIRAADDEKISNKLDGMSNLFTGFRMVWVPITAIALLVLGAFAGWAVPKAFDQSYSSEQPSVNQTVAK